MNSQSSPAGTGQGLHILATYPVHDGGSGGERVVSFFTSSNNERSVFLLKQFLISCTHAFYSHHVTHCSPRLLRIIVGFNDATNVMNSNKCTKVKEKKERKKG